MTLTISAKKCMRINDYEVDIDDACNSTSDVVDDKKITKKKTLQVCLNCLYYSFFRIRKEFKSLNKLELSWAKLSPN